MTYFAIILCVSWLAILATVVFLYIEYSSHTHKNDGSINSIAKGGLGDGPTIAQIEASANDTPAN